MVEIKKPDSDHDTAYKAVDYIETYTGIAFYPREPKVDDVSIIDIAHHLSNQCRYSGATSQFYSTAQHCCHLTDYVQRKGGTPLDCLQILMHDAAEAYLVDIPRPIKQHMPEFRVWDRKIQTVIREWLGINNVPIPPWQDEYDSRIIVDERAQVMSDSGNDWKHDLVPLGISIQPWSSVLAEQQFLMRYAAYMHKLTGTHQYLRASWGIPLAATFQFKTQSSDVGESDLTTITDLREVDLRGNIGRVALRSPDGMMVRDTNAGALPRPSWKWIRGKFELLTPGIDEVEMQVAI